MLTLISPAKSLDESTRPPAGLKVSEPRFLDRSQELIDVMRTKSPADVASLMHVSDEIAELNVSRYQAFETPFTRRNATPALYLFHGDVYQGINPRKRFETRDLTEATKTLRVLSGLYGLLRPLDLIQPYRLEMGIPLATERGEDVYQFWGTTLTEAVRADLEASPGARLVVNLASQEYSNAVDLDALDATVVSPRFEDRSPRGEWKVISFNAKRARGMMAGWLVTTRARTASAITRFDEGGYRYVKELSTREVPVFRKQA